MLVGVVFFLTVTLVTDFPAIGVLDWANDAWYTPAAMTRWTICGLLTLIWLIVYLSPIDDHKVEKIIREK